MTDSSSRPMIKKSSISKKRHVIRTYTRECHSFNASSTNAPSIRLVSSRKGGISPWISWVLILTFAVLLASIVSFWMRDYVSGTVGDLVSIEKRTEYCDLVGIDIDDLIVENSQTLNMKVINTYNLAVDRLIFRMYDTGNNILINSTNITIKPEQNKTISVPKNETTYRIEIVPVVIRDNEQFVCDDRMVWKNVT
ncbi:hypothetical protein GF345_03045 [Candidatus Woesearchaeota archaeon]|nr:hypothetical protein [Candidatus Woesearchaeota archaeon]